MKNTLLIFFVLWGILLSCSSDPNERLEEGKITDNKYYAERFGLVVDIPEGWRLVSTLEEEYLRQEGRELMEEEFGERKRPNSWINFLMIQKGSSLNQLILSRLDHQLKIHGSYLLSKNARFKGSKKMLENTPGVEVEAVRTVTDLDGVEFDTYNMLIRKNGEIKGYQIMLEKMYKNNEVLLISIIASDREALEELRVVLEEMDLTRKN